MTTAITPPLHPRILARLRGAPSRAFAAMVMFGTMLGVPMLLSTLSAAAFEAGLARPGLLLALLAFFAFVGSVIMAWVFIFRASDRLKRAEQALYAGDFDSATRDAHVVLRSVFRADYQMGALFTLGLAAERLGAFAEAGALFARALDMVPFTAAQRPGRRARALLAAHAALDFAAAGDVARSSDMLERCYKQVGPAGQPGALDSLLDDSAMGAIGINTMLLELENRRDPRPLAVLAALVVHARRGQHDMVLQMAESERASLEQGLAPHERALADHARSEAQRRLAGAAPYRAPGALAPATDGSAAAWASLVFPPP